MGADLLLMCFSIPKDKKLETAKKELIKAINNLSLEDRNTILQYYDNVYGDIHEQNKNLLDDAINEFKEIVKDTFERLNYRDVARIGHKNEWLYITGGMSWGDQPTETYGYFEKLCYLPPKVLQAANIG